MSRRPFPSNSLSCFVGWDNPTGSFWAMVEGHAKDNAQEVALEPFRNMGLGGNGYDTIPSLDTLSAALQQAGIEIPDHIKKQVLQDADPDYDPASVIDDINFVVLKGPPTTLQRLVTAHFDEDEETTTSSDGAAYTCEADDLNLPQEYAKASCD